jgi:hypothetical protein
MGKKQQSLGAASARWNDYVGTAAADDAEALLNARSLYQIAGLDRDRWTIVSIDVERWDDTHRVTLYAFDRKLHQVDTYTDVQELAARQGELPVTAFHLEDPAQVKAFRKEAFKRMAIRLTAQALTDSRLVVAEHERLSPVR